MKPSADARAPGTFRIFLQSVPPDVRLVASKPGERYGEADPQAAGKAHTMKRLTFAAVSQADVQGSAAEPDANNHAARIGIPDVDPST